jgi:hypothetical protein
VRHLQEGIPGDILEFPALSGVAIKSIQTSTMHTSVIIANATIRIEIRNEYKHGLACLHLAYVLSCLTPMHEHHLLSPLLCHTSHNHICVACAQVLARDALPPLYACFNDQVCSIGTAVHLMSAQMFWTCSDPALWCAISTTMQGLAELPLLWPVETSA